MSAEPVYEFDEPGWPDESERYAACEARLALILPTDSERLADLARPAREGDLPLLASISLAGLSDPLDQVAYLQAVDRVAGLVAAMRSDAVVAFAGAVPAGAYLSELHKEQELSVATRVSTYSAGRQIETARALEASFPSFKAALRAGEISQGHCTVLVDRTRPVMDPDALASIERVALPKAKRMTAGEFARECNALVIRFDRDAAARTRRARETRRVGVRQLEDGMGYLGLTHDWSTIAAIEKVVRADGRQLQLARRVQSAGTSDADAVSSSSARDCADVGTVGLDGVEDSTADACRADALAARLLGALDIDGAATWDRAAPRVEVQVVIDLATLRGENDDPCLLDGMAVTADLAREIAGYSTAFRRMVTDPVTGHLLDYGRLTYLPGPLRDYVLARDGGCRAPGCTNRAPSRLQMDHAESFPEGPSDAVNTGALCTTCHQLKTDGHASIEESNADGSCTWRTAWGQSVHIPARPFLPGRDEPPRATDPEPPPPDEPPPPPDDPPPF